MLCNVCVCIILYIVCIKWRHTQLQEPFRNFTGSNLQVLCDRKSGTHELCRKSTLPLAVHEVTGNIDSKSQWLNWNITWRDVRCYVKRLKSWCFCVKMKSWSYQSVSVLVSVSQGVLMFSRNHCWFVWWGINAPLLTHWGACLGCPHPRVNAHVWKYCKCINVHDACGYISKHVLVCAKCIHACMYAFTWRL